MSFLLYDILQGLTVHKTSFGFGFGMVESRPNIGEKTELASERRGQSFWWVEYIRIRILPLVKNIFPDSTSSSSFNSKWNTRKRHFRTSINQSINKSTVWAGPTRPTPWTPQEWVLDPLGDPKIVESSSGASPEVRRVYTAHAHTLGHSRVCSAYPRSHWDIKMFFLYID